MSTIEIAGAQGASVKKNGPLCLCCHNSSGCLCRLDEDSVRLDVFRRVADAARVVIAYNPDHDETCAAMEAPPLPCDCGIPALAAAVGLLEAPSRG